jgi:glycosyltransferase involved in cell wall biosynthesis
MCSVDALLAAGPAPTLRSPVKLALVTRRYPPHIGGAERVVCALAEALAAEGAEVTVYTSRLGVESLPAREEDRTRAGTLVVRRLGTSRLRFLGTALYMRNLRRALEADRPDLAYVSMLKHDAYVTLGVGRARGFPVVLRPEGAGATGDLAWQGWGRGGRRIAERCRRADAVVAISKPVKDELRRAGHDPARIVELPNGVPIPEPPWSRRASWRVAPAAAFVGRLAREKGLDTLVDAWPAVRAAFPGATVTLWGDGPERPALAARAASRGLAGAVLFPGPTADPTAALRAADLFVLPSREEGMSMALLEAMALGVPLVATAIPGNRRLVVDFRSGRLVAPGDPAALAAAIVDQWNDYDRAIHMARAARKEAALHYAIPAVARRHLDLFARLIAARRGAADGGPPSC